MLPRNQVIFFLTLWFPASYRARIVGYFMAAIPLSSALGSPVSAWLLDLEKPAVVNVMVKRRGSDHVRYG